MALTCGNCSSSINDDDAFCQTCGRPVPADGAAPAPGSDAAVEPAEPAVAEVPAGPPSWTSPTTGGMPPARPAAYAAVAPSGANDTYLGRRLTYSVPPEPTFDPLGSSRFLAQVALRAGLYALAYFLGAGILAVLFLVSNIGNLGAGENVNGFGDFILVLHFLYALALLVSFWFGKIPIQLSEWKLTVDGKGAAAPVVFEHISAVLYGRGTPIAPLRVERFQLPRVGPRDYLELHSDLFYGYVACFAYGTDLYIGWTFWSRLSPVRYVFMFIARIWQSVHGRGSDLYIALRFDTARAMRETMHSATREGVDVAVGRLEAQGQGIVGTAIPVTEHAAA